MPNPGKVDQCDTAADPRAVATTLPATKRSSQWSPTAVGCGQLAGMEQIPRPGSDVVAALGELGVDTITSSMDTLGVRRTFIEGPVARVPGSKICGPAVTLRFVPMREDRMGELRLPGMLPADTDPGAANAGAASLQPEEQAEKRSALWEVFDYVQPGDVIAVDGRGDLATGCFGEMLMTYFKAQGGAGVVIDACIRDSAQIFNDLLLPVWSVGVTTGGASHMNLVPADFNLPIGCGKVLVNPGDIIMADDGGAIVVPPVLIPSLLDMGSHRDTEEVFVRMKLREGGALSRYYPMDEKGEREYQAWEAAGRPGVPANE